VVQVAAIGCVLLRQLSAAPWVTEARAVSLNLTMALTVISGLHYAWIGAHRPAAAPAADSDAHSDACSADSKHAGLQD
jgi:cardiolipin synthase